MITDLIINMLLLLPVSILTGLDSLGISFSLPDDIFTTLYNLSKGVAYVLPLPWLLIVASVRVGVHIFRLPYAIFLRVKSFIPTISGG